MAKDIYYVEFRFKVTSKHKRKMIGTAYLFLHSNKIDEMKKQIEKDDSKRREMIKRGLNSKSDFKEFEIIEVTSSKYLGETTYD